MSKNILVIDEEKISFKGIVIILKEGLSETELSFDYVRTGSDGLQKLSQMNYNLIILDMMLPKGEMQVKLEREDLCYGVDVLEKIVESGIKTKVICFTNVRDTSIISEINRLGGIYICKLTIDSNTRLIQEVKSLIK